MLWSLASLPLTATQSIPAGYVSAIVVSNLFAET
jgi:hypothetical protein